MGRCCSGRCKATTRSRCPRWTRTSSAIRELFPVKPEQAAALACLNRGDPLEALVNTRLAVQVVPKSEVAEFNFIWLTAPGSAVFLAALLSMLLLWMHPRQIGAVFRALSSK